MLAFVEYTCSIGTSSKIALMYNPKDLVVIGARIITKPRLESSYSSYVCPVSRKYLVRPY